MSNENHAVGGETEISRGAFLGQAAQVASGLAVASFAGSSLATANAATEHAGRTVVLRLQNWFSQTDLPAWKIGLNMVKKVYPNIEIKLEYVDYNDTAVKTIAEAVAGNVPDLIMCSTDHTPALVSGGLLMDLNPFIATDKSVNPNDFYKGVSTGFYMGGRWWGFPYDNSSFGIYYNKELFDKAGVRYPPPATRRAPWTWNEFVTAAKALTKPSARQWGVYWGNPPWSHYVLANFILSAGGRNFALGLGPCTVNSPQTARALQFVVDLIHKHKVAPSPQDLGSPTNSVDYFGSGLAAMSLDGQWDVLTYEKTTKFPWDIGYFPIGKVKLLTTGGSGFAISKSTKHPQEAWKWLAMYTGKDILAAMIGRTGRSVPARKSAASSFAEAAKAKGIKYANVFVEQDNYTLNDNFSLALYEFYNYWNTALEPIFRTGRGDIGAALAMIEQKTNAVIKQKQKNVKVHF